MSSIISVRLNRYDEYDSYNNAVSYCKMTQEIKYYTDSQTYGSVYDNPFLQEVKAKFAATGASLDCIIGGEVESNIASWRTINTDIHLAADVADIKEVISTIFLRAFSGKDGYFYYISGRYFTATDNSEEILRIVVTRWTANTHPTNA